MPTFAQKPTPEFEAARKSILQNRGLNADDYDIDLDTGKIVDKPSAMESMATNMAFGMPEAAVGGASAGLTSALTSGLRNAPHPLIRAAGYVLPVLAAFGGPAIADAAGLSAAKQELMPNISERAQMGQEFHPWASTAGSALANIAGGFKISPAAVAATMRGARSLIGGVPFNSLSAAQKSAIINTTIGGSLGGGVGLAEELNDEKPGIDFGRVTTDAIGGALVNEPNIVGRRVFGFHPTPGIDTGRSVPSDRTGMAPTTETPIPLPYRRLMGQLAEKQGAEMVDTPQVLANDGTPVRGSYDPAQDELRRSLIQISESAGLHDTPPHELIHGVLLRLQSGSPGEKALANRALAAFGGDEEKLVQAAGEMFAGRFNGSEESLFRDLGSLVRDRFLRRGQPADYANILANTLQRQGSIGDITGQVPSLPARATSEIDPALKEALAQAGFGDVSPEELPKLLEDIGKAQAKKSPERAIASIEKSLAQSQQLMAIMPPEQRGPVEQRVKDLQRQLLIVKNASKIPAKVVELQLGSRTEGGATPGELPDLETGKPVARDKVIPSDKPFDTGERTHEETGYEGWQPAKKPVRILKQPTEDAPWEREGGEYPQPEEPLGRKVHDIPTPSAKGGEPITELPTAQQKALVAKGETHSEPVAEAERDYVEDAERRYQRFGPTEDQRKQPKQRVGLNPLAGEAMKLEKGGVEHKEMAGTVRELFDAMRSFKGKYANPIIGALETLPTASQQKLYEALVDERRLQQSLRGALNPDEQRAYDVVRSTLREMAQDQIAAGQPVWTASGKKRQRGIDPFYFPNVIDRGVHRILAEGQGTQAFADLRRDFIQHQIQGGVSQAEAEKRFARFQGTFARTPSTNHPFDFQAVRIQEGVGLPDSWIERDPTRALRSYTSRFARDRASWDILEKNPTTMKRLGSATYMGDVPIPAGTPGENLVKDPHLQRILADFTGKDIEDEPLIKGLTRLTSATIVGPLSKVADLVTSPFKAITYTAPGHTLDVIKGLLASPEGYRNAFRTGLNRRGGLVVAQDILGFGEELNGKLINVAEALTKYSGSEQLELVSRGISQAIGEAIGATHQRLAASGDAKSQQLLRKLGVTATTPKEEVGTRFAQLLQGRYDATNLPHFVTHGKMSPLFGLLRWSVEQTNNFERFVVEPAMQGDLRPLVLSVFAGLTGGLLINEAREQIMGKKPYTATWAELEAGRNKPGFRDALTYKLLSAANVSGTVGIVSDLAKQTYEFATGRSAQGFRYPLVNSAGDVLSRAIAGVRAIGEGEDVGEVLPQMLSDILKNNVQVYRLARNNLGRAGVAPEAQKEVQRANEVRDQGVWSRMEGKSQTVPTERPIDYRNISERRYEEAPLSEAVRMVPSLVKRASTRAGGDVMELAKNLRQTATVKPYGMPSMTSAKPDFIRYYNWVRQTQGPEAANRLVREYISRSQEAEVKRKLIPQVNVGR